MMSRITSILDLVTYAISALAIVIGGIGIINTMIMAVYERTKEIGVLRAVGWKSRRILMMIIGETLVLTTLSAIVGIIGGVHTQCDINAMTILNNGRIINGIIPLPVQGFGAILNSLTIIRTLVRLSRIGRIISIVLLLSNINRECRTNIKSLEWTNIDEVTAQQTEFIIFR